MKYILILFAFASISGFAEECLGLKSNLKSLVAELDIAYPNQQYDNLSYFTKKAENSDKSLSKYYVKPDEIGEISVVKNDLDGKISTVFEYIHPTSDKKEFLKILPSNIKLENYQYKLLLQDHFAEMGLSPQIKHIFNEDAIRALRSTHDYEISEFAKLGYSMEKLTPGITIKDVILRNNVKSHEMFPKPLNFLSNDKIDVIENKIRKIEDIFNKLEVKVEDAQFYITKEGDVFLIDFDYYEWTPDIAKRQKNFKPIDFEKTIEYLKSFSKK